MSTPTPGRPGRPRRTAAELAAERRRVAHEALRLFALHGVAATSADDVARAAGVSLRTFWRLFPRKEDAVRPLLEDGVATVAANVRARGVAGFRADGSPVPDEPLSSAEPVRTLVRLTRNEPAIRAAWLDVYDSAEAVFADALAVSRGETEPGLGTRTTAAVVNAALRVAVEEWAWRDSPADALARLTDEALRQAADALDGRADGPTRTAEASRAD
ncbi:TetR family transcriptional regulator [Luteimicrobium album]|uniref:TetR family transcriptional regulator n=1 Tax=Luteimicrobium album TaxID=1054550 RepID=A0ABQ6HVC1_9MICO|nr:TetR/AcrR family transcriptional regulator [Luteimicrobium album]GMA22347.1 TetR family transcriptional regulator [Luteimicrobium album]